MYLNADYITPQELTGYVRAALGDRPQNAFRLSRWLPNQNIDDLDYRFTRGGEGLVEAATYRSYDAESPIGARKGLTRVQGELPPISRKIRMSEYDRLRQRRAPGAIRGQILSDARRMALAVSARFEIARGDALVNGSVTINENGVIATVSFGRTGTHTVTAGILWSTTATAVPVSDLIAWKATYVATNGVEPERIVMSTTAFGYLMRNAEMRAVWASTAGTPSIVDAQRVGSVLTAFGLPPIEINDEQVSIAGVATRILPVNKILMLPAPGDPNGSNELGATLLGTTAESMEPEYGIGETEQPGIVAGAYTTKDPVAVWTKAAAIGLPVVANPDLTFTATVA